MKSRFIPKNLRYTHTMIDGLALISGGCLTLAFAPYAYFLFALFSLAVLLACWVGVSPGKAFWRGWLFGLGFFSTSISWIYHSIHLYGQAPLVLAVLAAAVLVAYCALFPALVGYLLNRFFHVDGFARYGLGFPGLWVFGEWLRSTLFSGFPWMQMGVSQVHSPLRGLAPILGVYGMSYVLAASAGILLYVAIVSKQLRIILFSGLLVVWGGSYLLTYCQWAYPIGDRISVSLIQGNITQSLKWNQDQFLKTLDIYKELVVSQLGTDMIILPESAIPAPSWMIQNYLDDLDQRAKKAGSILVVGVPFQEKATSDYTNSLLVLGASSGKYDKRHLVPFGEYFPFADIFQKLFDFMQIPMSNFKEGVLEQAPLLIKSATIAPFICYEVAYGNLVHFSLPEAQALLVLSDDSWFGDSNAPAQHLQIMQMRALETQRTVMSATNDGITAIIHPDGTVVEQAPRFQRTILRSVIDGMHGMTPLMWYGENMVLLLFFILTLIGLIFQNMLESEE